MKALRFGALMLAGLQIGKAHAGYQIDFGYSNDHDSSKMLTCAQFKQGDSGFDRLFSYFKVFGLEDAPPPAPPAPTQPKAPAQIAPAPEYIADPKPAVVSPVITSPVIPPTPKVAENKPDSASTMTELESKPHLMENLNLISL
jgi:hypothetical protein